MGEHARDSQPSGPGRAAARQGTRGGKWIGRAFILLWIVLVVAVYVVIVQLQVKGSKGLRVPPAAGGGPSTTTPSDTPGSPGNSETPAAPAPGDAAP